jgi:hypothetical protein
MGDLAVSSVEAIAGTIPSNRGNASVAPTPRKNMRRGMAFLNIIMTVLTSSSEMARC